MQLPKLTEAEKAQLRLEIEKEIYQRSLYEFFVAASKVLYPQVEWKYPPFYKYICDTLQAEVERIIRKEPKTYDYIYNLPFRTGKSILLSQIFPVWCWIKEPALAIMQVSHSETLAIKHSHASKMLIESEWFKQRFPALLLRTDTHAKSNFMNQAGGKRISFGVGSGIIGEGANIQIIDDINNPQDSQAVTQGINETYTDTLYSRLNNPDIDLRIILQQRISQTDICQYLLDTNPQKYFHVCLPVKFAKNISPPEAVEFYHKGLLWEDRFSEKVIADFQSTLGSRAFAGQLMQRPLPDEGGILKRIHFKIIKLEEFNKLTDKQSIEWYAFVDTAYGGKQTNDATAIIIACKFNNQMYIIKVLNVWLEFPQLISKLKELQKQYNLRLIYVESKASGLSIIQQLRNDGFNVSTLTADKDKIARANAIAPILEGGRITIVEDMWNEMFLSQIASFPFAHDDMVDAFVYGVDKLLGKIGFNYAIL
jgi:predicted phage terminase large subunit-like protein